MAYDLQEDLGVDDIVGLALGTDLDDIVGDDDDLDGDDDEMGLGDEIEDQLAAALGIGADELGRRVRRARQKKTAKKKSSLNKLAMLRAAGQLAANKQNSGGPMKDDLLPIPRTTIPAGTTVTVAVRPTNSQRIDRTEFPSSNPDHGFITLLDVQIRGVTQLNGAGGIPLSLLTEARTSKNMRGSTAQGGQDILCTFRNDDLVNARTLFGAFSGPVIRAGQ
jgi:hypothetical protein